MRSLLLDLNTFKILLLLMSPLGVLTAGLLVLFASERRRRLHLQNEIDAIKICEESRAHASVDRDQTIRSLAVATLARQIAHDIRSPMTALRMAAGSAEGVTDDVRKLLIASGARLGQIADTLLQLKLRTPNEGSGVTEVQLAALMKDILNEKRRQYSARQDVELVQDLDEAAFVRIDPVEWKRVLSNLLHNAYAAVKGKGRIEVSTLREGDRITIQIRDSGDGFDQSLLRVIREKSPLLADGRPRADFGIGIPHAQLIVEASQGRLNFNSSPKAGTSVTIELPAIQAPSWYVPILQIQTNQVVIVIDDDLSMHEVWQNKLKAFGVQTAFFSSTKEAATWLQDLKPTSYICLVDYDLGVGLQTGLEFIRMNGLETTSVLVTGQADELHERCKELRLRLLSKSSLPRLKIEALSS